MDSAKSHEKKHNKESKEKKVKGLEPGSMKSTKQVQK